MSKRSKRSDWEPPFRRKPPVAPDPLPVDGGAAATGTGSWLPILGSALLALVLLVVFVSLGLRSEDYTSGRDVPSQQPSPGATSSP